MTPAINKAQSVLAASLISSLNLRSLIMRYLNGRSGISLFEMCRDIPGFAGDFDWFLADANLLIWSGMSKEACQSMMDLIIDGCVTPTITNSLVYAFDGEIIDLPVGDEIKFYETLTWVPHVFAGEGN